MSNELLEKARRLRAERVAVLQACRCAWPLKVYRNGHGHDSACPAARLKGGV